MSAAEPLHATQGSFFIGGQYVEVPNIGTVMDGAMYVQFWIPDTVTHRYPIVLIHGGVGSGTTWSRTPDGRDGWAQFFTRRGFSVYAIDQPARGRSPLIPVVDGTIGQNTVLGIEQAFTAVEVFNAWPQAHLHTQWPSTAPACTTVALGCKGQQGDPVFDAFMRGAGGSLANGTEAALLNRADGAALLDRIGPAIVLGRSQGAPFPFLYADARPGMVKGIIFIEGGAPSVPVGTPAPSPLTPLWGITSTPITYSPAVTDPGQLVKVLQTVPDGPNLALCWMQGTPVHTLPTLAGIPTMVMVSEAGSAAQNQHCVSKYLSQAGVKNDLVRLENNGIHGNGHLMNSEANSDQIAALLVSWLAARGL